MFEVSLSFLSIFKKTFQKSLLKAVFVPDPFIIVWGEEGNFLVINIALPITGSNSSLPMEQVQQDERVLSLMD